MMSPRSGGRRTIVVALGGNALQPPAGRGDIHEQFTHTRESLESVVALAGEGWQIAVVHGNGPQIGDELRRNELTRAVLPPMPLGVLVAGTAGWIGYMIQQSLQNALDGAGVRRDVVTVMTQVVVDPEDPATHEPVKPIGRLLDSEAAGDLRRKGVPVAEVKGGWRRLTPSPLPLRILEHVQIRNLVDSGTIVIAAGGGGTPVYIHPDSGIEGLDAVIDKDRAAQVLAGDIDASEFVILTDVEGVYRGFGTASERLVPEFTVKEGRAMLAAGELGKGSMAPKVEAALAFVEAGGSAAHIGRLDQGLDVVQGKLGTTIRP